jgi:hypothetical protein
MINQSMLTAFVLVILLFSGVGCASTPEDATREPMPTESARLIGNWTKATSSNCDQLYPDSLQFQESGLYMGQMANPGVFTLWDVGTYEVVDDETIIISTANDAEVRYSFSIADEVLTFEDPDGCSFRYRRIPDADQ